jgi:hypothetical protein
MAVTHLELKVGLRATDLCHVEGLDTSGVKMLALGESQIEWDRRDIS